MDLPTFVWLFVVMKIPIIALLWLVWYAIQEPEPIADEDHDRGGSDRHRRPFPRHPRPPRRGGPHGKPLPAPERTRTVVKGRRTSPH